MKRYLAFIAALLLATVAWTQTVITIPQQTVSVPAAPSQCVALNTNPAQTLCGPGLALKTAACTTPQPAANTRAGTCPAGTTGSWTQTQTYAAATYPACWAAGPWLPASAPSGACNSSSTGQVPTNVTATAQPYTALISFTEPAAPAGKTILSYSAQSTTQGWINGAAPHSPVLAQGGNAGWGNARNAFQVKANYSDGTSSAWSATSNDVLTTGGAGPSTSANIYVNGVFYWQGDYSYGLSALQYNDTTGGADPDLAFWSTDAGGWQPYSPTNDYDLTPYKYIVMDLKGGAGQSWSVWFELPNDTAPPGGQVAIIDGTGKYGPAPVADTWGTYKVPLSDINVGAGTPSPHIYKAQIHCRLNGKSLWFIKNARFSTQ